MFKFFIILFFILQISIQVLSKDINDTIQINELNKKCWENREKETWMAIRLGLKSLDLCQKNNYFKGESQILNYLGVCYFKIGDYTSASRYFFNSLEFSTKHSNILETGYAFNNIGNLLMAQGDCRQALNYAVKALEIHRKINNQRGVAYAMVRMAESYKCLNLDDSLMDIAKKAYIIRQSLNDQEGVMNAKRLMALSYEGKGKYSEALKYFNSGSNSVTNLTNYYNDLTRVFLKLKNFDMAIHYGLKSYRLNAWRNTKTLAYLTSAFIKKNDTKNALFFAQLEVIARDSLAEQSSSNFTKNLQILYESKEKEKENTALRLKLQTKTLVSYVAILIAFFAFLLGCFFYIMRKKDKETNRLLNQKNEEISAQRDKLEELDNTKNKFFSIIAHDLRGPMASLDMFLTYIIEEKKKMTEEHLHENLLIVKGSTETTYQLLESLLTWARCQRGEIVFAPTKCLLSALIQTNIQLFVNIAKNKNIELLYNSSDLTSVFADKEMISTVIRNLMNNALKYTGNGGMVRISAEELEATIEISVSDTGMGMEADYISKVFNIDSKHRSKDGTNGEKGTGLGLILCKDFIERHNGLLEISSVLGYGSVFKIILPKV